LIGWANFAAAYQRQRQRIQSVRLDRSNTAIRVDGNVAWAAYQWRFEAEADGKPTAAIGHTTLVLEKRNGQWLIVHNHTSLVQEIKQPPAPPPASEPQPAKPPSGAGGGSD
jgi:ketosteroid isomerase-like protein